MTGILICVLQATAVLAIGAVLSRVALRRSPSLSAKLGLVAMSGATAVVLLALLGVPRLLTVSELHPFEPKAHVHARHDEFSGREHNNAEGAIQFSPNSLLKSLPGDAGKVTAAQRSDRTPVFMAALAMAGGLAWLACFARLVHGVLSVIELRRASVPLDPSSCDDWTKSVSDRTLRTVRFRQSDRVGAPCVTWISRHEILVPPSFSDWPAVDREAAIAHEATHLQRRDATTRLVVEFLLLVLCLHPIAFFIRRQLVLAQELSADQGAVSQGIAVHDYRRSLSRLALYLDMNHRAQESSFCVSVSTNALIRRIKMLNDHAPGFTRWQQTALWLLLLSVTSGISLVSTRADETVRIASRARNADETVETTFFRRPTSEPWKSIGDSDTYLRIDMASLSRLPTVRENLAELQKEAFPREDVFDPGFLAEELQSVTSNLKLAVYRRRSKTPLDRPWAMNTSIDAMHLQFSSMIDWSLVAEELNWELLTHQASETATLVRQVMDIQDESDALRFVKWQPAAADAMTARAIWKRVDGGVVTAVWRVHDSFQNAEAADADETGTIALVQKCSSIGVGIDMDEEGRRSVARVLLLPAAPQGVDDLKRAISALVVNPSEADAPPQLPEMIAKADVVVEQLRGRPVILLETEFALPTGGATVD